jgi:acyl-CoA hydrolase
MQPKRVSESLAIMTEMIMPNDTNPLGNLMGGNLMRWIDIVGAISAARHANKDVVTVSVDHVSFQKPIHIGDVITLQASVTRAFNTSVEVYVEVFAAGMKGDNQRKCNHAYLTFVALNSETKEPCEVPPVLPLTGEEQDRYDSALRRRELRLVLSGRMKVQEAKNLKALFDSV